jgi:hypothetical protein
MEYPMVINPTPVQADHETGHQWWPDDGQQQRDLVRLDGRGFNEYMNILSDADSRETPPNPERAGQSYGRTSGSEDEPPMMWNANYGGPATASRPMGRRR